MHIDRITLLNWGPFRGGHTIELGPGVYGVVARLDGDSQRSNWLGKSWFLGAIRFALHGRLPPGCPDADGWITHGEDKGLVMLELSDGTIVRRTRERGKSTQLEVTVPDREAAKQKTAQDVLDELLGLDREDFEAAMVVAQKQADRMVTDDPADRTKLVDGWIGLAPLRAAESHATDQRADWRDQIETAERELAHAVERAEEAGDPKALETEVDELTSELGLAQERAGEAQVRMTEAREKAAEHARLTAAADEFDRTAERGREVRAALEGAEGPEEVPATPAEEDVASIVAEVGQTEARAQELRTLVHGDGFDGTCPVTCEGCPVADEIRAKGREMAVQADEAENAAREADQQWAVAKWAQKETALVVRANERLEVVREKDEAELERLTARARELRPDAEAHAEVGRPDPEGDGEMHAVAEASRLSEQLDAATFRLRKASEERDLVEQVRGELEDAQRWARAWHEAASVVRRARRAIAAQSMGQIEAGANELLVEAGVDLSVEVSWERPTKKLADACVGCGRPHPRSQAVKQCEACGAARGPKMEERLDVVPVPRSGAADDVAGLGVQLSAAAWLKRRRGAAWATVLVDEALAACDADNSSRLTTALLSVLRQRHGFEQAFIVTHRAEQQDRFPARILIRSNGTDSRLEVC